jgi:hypothetical protein
VYGQAHHRQYGRRASRGRERQLLLFESGSVDALAGTIVKATEGQLTHAPARISMEGTDRMIDLYRNMLTDESARYFARLPLLLVRVPPGSLHV